MEVSITQFRRELFGARAGFATIRGLKVDAQLRQLVSAMATYAADDAGFDPNGVSASPSDATLQSAVAAAWHRQNEP